MENHLHQNACMAKKTSTDRHKPSRMVRVRESLAAQLDLVAEENATDLTEEVNRAIREMLVREGKWPPPPKK